MVPFVAKMIMKSRDISLEKGQAKYAAYFVNTRIYAKYRADVDLILKTTEREDGVTYEDCILPD